jgi:hypothetical protein
MVHNEHVRMTWRWPAVAWLLIVTSMASLAVIVVQAVVLGALTPGYSHASQFISELGASGARHAWAARWLGFLPAGLLLLGFCALALAVLPRSAAVVLGLLGLAIYAAGYVVAAQFPCDPGCRPAQPSPSQAIHNAVGGLGYLLAPAFLLALAESVRRWAGPAWLVNSGRAAAALALLGLVTLSPSSPFVGLSQRVLEGAVLGWVALLGLVLARRARLTAPPRP